MNRYLTPILLTVLSCAVYVGYVQSAYTSIQEALVRTQQLDLDIADANNAHAELEKFSAQVAGFPVDGEERIQKMVPDSIDPMRLIVEVDYLMQSFGLALRSPSVTKVEQSQESPAEYDTYKFEFRLVTTYPTFRAFLHALEDSLALRDASVVSFERETGGKNAAATSLAPEQEIFEYHVEILSYSLRKKANQEQP